MWSNAMEYYLAVERNQVLIRATIWRRLKNIMLIETDLSENIIYHVIHKLSKVNKSVEIESRLVVV